MSPFVNKKIRKLLPRLFIYLLIPNTVSFQACHYEEDCRLNESLTKFKIDLLNKLELKFQALLKPVDEEILISLLETEIADKCSKGELKVAVLQEILKVKESLSKDPLSTQVKASIAYIPLKQCNMSSLI